MTRLGDKLRVIPLDAGRLSRVEENVLAAAREVGRPSPARPRRAAIAWTAAGAALAAAVALLVGRSEPVDRAPARVDLGDAAILLTPGSRAAIRTRADGARLVELTSGRVDCEVQPRPGRAPFLVHAGDVTVEVVGTIFSVERASRGEDVKVAVSRGVVRVAPRGRAPVQVAAGQTWSRRVDEVVASSGSQPNTSPEGDPGAHGAEDRLAAGPADRAARDSSSGGTHGGDATVGAADRRPGEHGEGGAEPGKHGDGAARTGDPGDGAARTGDPGDGAARTGEHGDGAARTGDPGDGAARTGDPGDRAARTGDPGDGAARPGDRDEGAARPGDRASGSRGGGRASSRSGHAGASAADPLAGGAAPDDLPPLTCEDVDACRRAALGSVGPVAGEALYSLIYIELFREKDPGQAITLAELYERRFARRRDREAEAVLWLRVIAHGAAGEPAGRRDAARRYLERHPRGRFSANAARLLGE